MTGSTTKFGANGVCVCVRLCVCVVCARAITGAIIGYCIGILRHLNQTISLSSRVITNHNAGPTSTTIKVVLAMGTGFTLAAPLLDTTSSTTESSIQPHMLYIVCFL